jgi:hypothetical protein
MAFLEEPYVPHSVRPTHTPKTRLLKEGTFSSIANLKGIDMRTLKKVTRFKPIGLLPHTEIRFSLSLPTTQPGRLSPAL